jgi:hypothetical protein
MVLKNNLLICVDNISGNVVWSKNIFIKKEDTKMKKKFGSISDFKIVNNKINIYSKNGYLLSFNSNDGNLIYKSSEIEPILGYGGREELVHRSDMVMSDLVMSEHTRG